MLVKMVRSIHGYTGRTEIKPPPAVCGLTSPATPASELRCCPTKLCKIARDAWYHISCYKYEGTTLVAKGQKRSNREAKKPKKTAAERLKASQAAAERQIGRISDKDVPRKG
jgi:hypothetical protein